MECWGRADSSPGVYSWKLHRCFREASSALSVSLLLALLLAAAPFERATAQQNPPLEGQGVDPFVSGHVAEPVPVFMSVELVKLQSIDEREYEFQAILNVEQSWSDPRTSAIFRTINAYDRLNSPDNETNPYSAAQLCSPNATVPINTSSPDCEAVIAEAPGCHKYCTTYGQETDNPWRCCDAVWLPDIEMPNLIDTTQDRVVYDAIWNFSSAGVHRQTRIQGKFFAPMQFRKYPFDSQQLDIFLNSQPSKSTQPQVGFFIVPSATFRRLNQAFVPYPDGTADVRNVDKDELAGWSINNFAFSCAVARNGSNGRSDFGIHQSYVRDELSPWIKDQDYDPYDPYTEWAKQYYQRNESAFLRSYQACAISITVSRISSTLFLQSVLPVAFIGALAFVVFFVSPDDVDLRLGTEITLFLANTALQFVFVDKLPLATYLTNFDVFILITYCVIVVIVLESLAVYYICKREEDLTRKTMARSGAIGSLSNNDSIDFSSRAPNHKSSEPPEGAHLVPVSEDVGEGGASIESEGQPDGKPQAVGSQRRSSKGASGALTVVTAPAGALNELRTTVVKAHDRFGHDAAFAYRIARLSDKICGVVLFITYVVLSICNFTVGLT